MSEREVEVTVTLGDREVLAGRLWAHRRNRGESQTFSYDSGYLADPGAYELDPGLPLASGAQHTPVGREIFGAFSDCAPDRWGRRLIARDERHRVKREGGAERSFGETDFLLGVRDDLRQGALRFRDASGYLADDETGVPALLDLPRLLGAAERLEREEETDDDLAALLRGGSSLGGARPKAHVLDADGRLAIAKFPSPANDEWDVMRWEAVALGLARKAGIRVPDHRLHVIAERPVLIVNRFDRDGTGTRRIGYASAMTMLGYDDGDSGSYLEIADAIVRQSASAGADLRELWRRMAFSVLISNFDDHLRNHGFLRSSSAGWSLSPAFDLNPDPRPGARHLQTAIDFDDTAARIGVLMAVAREFRLNETAAVAVLGEVTQAVGGWRDEAAAHGVPDVEIARMAPAFEHEAAEEAAALIAQR